MPRSWKNGNRLPGSLNEQAARSSLAGWSGRLFLSMEQIQEAVQQAAGGGFLLLLRIVHDLNRVLRVLLGGIRTAAQEGGEQAGGQRSVAVGGAAEQRAEQTRALLGLGLLTAAQKTAQEPAGALLGLGRLAASALNLAVRWVGAARAPIIKRGRLCHG